MRDLKFSDAASSLNWKMLNVDAVQSSACKSVVTAFNANVNGVLTILSMPGMVTWVTTAWNAASTTAQKETVGLNNTQPLSQSQLDEIGNRAGGYLRRAMNNPDVHPRLMMIQMTNVFETNFSRSNILLHSSLESILKMVLVQIWTAFEVLAQELWENVINEHPHHLAGLDGKSGPVTMPPSKKDAGKQVSLNVLRENGYDLSHAMGTVLKEKFNFTVLDEVRRAYISAFASDRDEIERIISDKSLDALAAMRHMIVHRAGVIDKDFMDDSNGLSVLAAIRSLGLKQPVLIDGDLVRVLVEPVLNCGSALIYEVDKWLTNHPTPS